MDSRMKTLNSRDSNKESRFEFPECYRLWKNGAKKKLECSTAEILLE